MIKVMQIVDTDSNPNSYRIVAFADTKDEVDNGDTFVGLPRNATIEIGSMVMTADKDVAFMQSDGTWNWG